MKTKTKALLAVLLCAVLTTAGLIPAFAWEWPAVEPTWQEYIESVTPVGDEPYAKMKLTPTQYKFAEWAVPMAYDVAMKDGTTQRVEVFVGNRHYAEGAFAGYLFDVDVGEETLTLYAEIIFYRDDVQCAFEIGQYVTAQAVDDDGIPFNVYYGVPITHESCKTEIEQSSPIVTVLYRFYRIFEKLRRFFLELGL